MDLLTNTNTNMNRRRSHGVRALCLTPGSADSEERVRRRRRRGNGERRRHRNRRAGARRTRRKADRLGFNHVRVGYWNCRSARQRGPVLERLIYDFDVIMLQELNTDRYQCPGYISHINPVGQGRHGQGLLVKEEVRHEVLDLSQWNRSAREVQGIQIKISGLSWNLINVYAKVDGSVRQEQWDWLKELEELPGDRLLICGDFNARNNERDSSGENRQGIALADAMADSDVVCINDGRQTRMAMKDGDADTAIDLAFVSHSAVLDAKWSVLNDHGSDHLPCVVLISKSSKVKAGKARKSFHYEQTNTLLGRLRQRACSRTVKTTFL